MSSLSSVRRRVRGAGATGEEGVAILMALFLIMMVSAVSVAMAAVILNQATPTQEARKQIVTVSAAASGLQAALGNLRNANDGTGYGDLDKLACTGNADAKFDLGADGSATTYGSSYSGDVRDGAAAPTFDVSVAYYLTDPTGKNASWLKTNAMPCAAGSLEQVPGYAFLQSYGEGAQIPGNPASQGDRSQTAVYQFSTTNVNVVGGRLRQYGTDLCLDVGGSPGAGTPLTFQSCLAIGTPSQTWQYRSDLTLFWGGDVSRNLCIQASSSMTPRLQTCANSLSGGVVQTYPYLSSTQQAQEWPFNDNGHFASASSTGNVGTTCLQPATTNTVGSALVLIGCSGGTTTAEAFNPDPQVGAGKAGGVESGTPDPPTNQFVNYSYFGRCLDITGQNVNADHLIAYPCKQAPNPANVAFNQRWYFTSTAGGGYGQFYVVYSSTKYCLTAPSSGNLITTKVCQTSLPANQNWKATGKVIPTDYYNSYLLINQGNGKCMSASEVGELTFGSPNIVQETCNGSLAQKWNSPATPFATGLSAIQEVAGG